MPFRRWARTRSWPGEALLASGEIEVLHGQSVPASGESEVLVGRGVPALSESEPSDALTVSGERKSSGSEPGEALPA